MTLALYGGSFNPPHKGHVALARKALETLRPDKLIWMPSGDPPHKAMPPNTPSPAHRLEMSRLAVEGLPHTEVSDFELSGGAKYTYDTVVMLRERYNPGKVWLLMGSDMWETFDSWHKADALRELCEPYVFPRNIVPASSTEARMAMNGETLPPKVWEYIRREGLYGPAKP
ncbi:MAG: nicotinate-nicotinamide nucleotide adenylyltransferase [Oscillospiraceae bacterium]|nr:nicotinate-nicotinamide nucleotide adenylyltransferase [Oscillospiraceae bacterium]